VSPDLRKVESVSARESNSSMKQIPGFVRFTSGPVSQKWIKGGAIFLTAVTLSAGCGKKSEQAAPTAPQANAVASSQPAADPANQAVNQPNQGANQPTQPANQPTLATAAPAPSPPDLTVLNRAVRRWLMANRRVPKDFDDFAATAGVPIPSAPPGKKYILSSDMHVQLVNQ